MAGRRAPEPFHQRGRHVQHAHGRRTAKLASDGSHLNGGMIALIPAEADAKRLAVKGGEAVGDLHLTLRFLGDDGTAISGEDQRTLVEELRMLSKNLPSVKAKIFGIAHWNGGGDSPSWVWSVGNIPGEVSLLAPYEMAGEAVFNTALDIPDQHCPWVAHICAVYTDDLSLAKELEKRLGEVTFDRIRLAFGTEHVDIPLTGDAITAAGVMHRDPTGLELECRTDFAAAQANWDQAVSGVLDGMREIIHTWRSDISGQIAEMIDSGTPERLPTLSVESGQAAPLLYRHMRELAQAAGREQQREAEEQGVEVPEWNLDPLTAALSGRDLLRGVSRLTAKLMSTSLVQAAQRRVTSLLGSRGSGAEIAEEVDAELADMSDTGMAAMIGTAMSTAQNTGRRAVLEVAPPGEYYASEILDKNTCSECRKVDGEQFASLEIAIKAYPVSGYKDCIGSRYGNNCRGMIVARWQPDSGEEPEETAATMRAESDQARADEDSRKVLTVADEQLGGKPNQGTKKDKRLHENAYDADMECPPGEECEEEDEDTDVEFSAWPRHHGPDGSLDREGLASATRHLPDLVTDQTALARVKAHFRDHYAEIGEECPEQLRSTLQDEVALALAAREEASRTAAGEPDAMVTEEGRTAPWEGVLAVEDQVTGDGREFAGGALTWSDLPLPLRWNKEDSHGGEPHTVAVNVGRIDKIWRDGNKVMGAGVLNLAVPDGQQVHDMIKGEFIRGVSIDADSITDAMIEYIWPDDVNSGSSEDEDMGDIMMLFAQPEKMIFKAGRIRAATLVDIPAFAEAYIGLTSEDGALIAGGKTYPELVRHQGVYSRTVDGLVAHGGPEWKPPAEWFADPKLSVPTGIQVTDDGRVYGHAAQWGTCHIGQSDVCVQPPHEDSHPYYMTGEVSTREGRRVSVGQITVGTGHAPLSYGAVPATEHYDNTGSAVADVAVGNDGHGIWVAGAIRPGADPLLVHELRASGQVSGDWRRIGNSLRLVGLLAVNIPGFPVPKMKARVASGAAENQTEALVAAGRPTVVHAKSEEEIVRYAFRVVMDKLFQQVHEGR